MSSSIKSNQKIIETELIRKQYWNKLRTQILDLKLEDEHGRFLNFKENSNLMLRYCFNKIITRKAHDDPVMITSESSIAKKQVIDDFTYHKIINYSPYDFSDILEKGFIEGKIAVDECKEVDHGVIYSSVNGVAKLRYRGSVYDDIANLASSNRKYVKEAIALQIRYTYLRLDTHGLANDYKNMGFKPTDAIEAFASAFNHYFDKYYSAFPDLESCFGSLGSFFEADIECKNTIMINPPFDLQIMFEMIKRIISFLELNKSMTFNLTLPAWIDVKEFMALEASKYTTKFIIIPKDQTRFINHMKNEQIIQPCSIIQITMSNEH